MAEKEAEKMAKIDPEFAELLKTIPTPPPVSEVPLAAMRESLAARKRNLNASGILPSSDTINITEISVQGRDEYAIPIRIYQPKSSPRDGSPLIILFHGGGFCLGDLDGEDLNCRLFAAELGAVVVNPDYRLAPEHPFPAGINDCWDVLTWAASNADSLGADTSKGFVIGGTSAGGNIAACLAVHARDASFSPPLTGLALLIPALTDHRNLSPILASELTSIEQNANAAILSTELMIKFEEAYNPDTNSPLFNVLGTSTLENFPKTWFQVCGMDPLRDEALVFEEELRKLGIETRLNVYDGVPHAYWTVFPTWEKSRTFVKDTVEGFKWLLK